MRDREDVSIRVTHLTKRFGSFTAVDGVSFDVYPGEILVFLGPNGAGKTTIIKMIMGLLVQTEGSIFIKGDSHPEAQKEKKKCLGYMSQKFSLYPLLNVRENIEFYGGISGLKREDIRIHQQEIKQRIPKIMFDQKVCALPQGIRQKIALHISLMTDPEILLLDEPTTGVAPEARRQFWMDFHRLKRKNKTILITTHCLDEAEYADRVIILNRGSVILEGSSYELVQSHGGKSIEDLFKEAVQRHERH